MSIFENIKVWYKTESGEKVYLDRISDDAYGNGDVEVRLITKIKIIIMQNIL